MFRILLVLFILVPIIEIAVFIKVGDQIGANWTIVIVVLTAILGVNLLKQQGFKAWQDIQQRIASGNMAAVEMVAAAQLLFAGALLLTPGFVTDAVGFLLMVPQVRMSLARYFIGRKNVQPSGFQSQTYYQPEQPPENSKSSPELSGRTIEGEFEEKDK